MGRPRRWDNDELHDIARRIREGEALEDFAGEYGVTASAIDQQLRKKLDISPVTGQPVGDGLPSLRRVFAFPDWVMDANCVSTDPEAFFPEKGGSTREAKNICARCTVAAECLDYALENRERFGIFGGLSERERRRLLDNLDRQENTA